jgi:hypothetical protein
LIGSGLQQVMGILGSQSNTVFGAVSCENPTMIPIHQYMMKIGILMTTWIYGNHLNDK